MKVFRERLVPGLIVPAVCLCIFLAAGCQSHPSNQQIQQQAAQTTRQVKQDTEQVASKARVAAGEAEAKINAVAAGVKQGLQGSVSAPAVDLNSATRDQLSALPGITPARARKIIAGRPYSASNDLVSREILTQSQFDQISNRITAQPPAP